MQLSIIVAMNKHQVIGKDEALPWHISSDLKNFKRITMGKPILMGRKTHESIGKPLPGRENIILTANQDYLSEGCIVKNTLDEALLYCEEAPEVMVIGGATLYEQIINKAEKLYITEVIDTNIDGNIFFPEYDRSQWLEISRDSFKADENNEYAYSFTVLERK